MSNEPANSRINNYWERVALFLMGTVLALTVWAFQEQSKRVEKLEGTIIGRLYQLSLSEEQ